MRIALLSLTVKLIIFDVYRHTNRPWTWRLSLPFRFLLPTIQRHGPSLCSCQQCYLSSLFTFCLRLCSTSAVTMTVMIDGVICGNQWDMRHKAVQCIMWCDGRWCGAPWQSRALMRTKDMCPNQMQITWHLHQYCLSWSWYNVHMYMSCNNRRYLLRILIDR